MTKKYSAPLIFIIISATILMFAGFLMRNAFAGETNLDLLTAVMYPCEPISIMQGEKMVILRIDDIQSYAWEDISIRMMNDAKVLGLPLVLGVIPKGIGDSQKMYSYLRTNRCHLEIAQHGWDHNQEVNGESPEFRGLSQEEAYADIMKGKSLLERLTRERITTFIPPNNELSEGTRKALVEADIPALSSEGVERFDFGATTFDFDIDAVTSVEEVLGDCSKRFKTSDLCVIMMHPQDYVTKGIVDENKYRIYTELLATLKQKPEYTFVRFKDLVDFDRTYEPWKEFLGPFSNVDDIGDISDIFKN